MESVHLILQRWIARGACVEAHKEPFILRPNPLSCWPDLPSFALVHTDPTRQLPISNCLLPLTPSSSLFIHSCSLASLPTYQLDMASQNQLEMSLVAVVPKLQNQSPDMHEGNNNIEDEEDFTGRCKIGVPMLSILTSFPCKLKSFCVAHDDIPTKDQKSNEGEKDEEGSFDHSSKGGWKTMPFIIGELLPILVLLMLSQRVAGFF